MSFSYSSIPHLYEKTYTDIVEGYLLVYQPLSRKGITVLNKSSAFLFNLINSKRTLSEIFLLAKTRESGVKYSQIAGIFKDFVSSEIIYFNSLKLDKTYLFAESRMLLVWFHITNQCNLRCKYCYVWKTPEKMSNEISIKAINRILFDAKKHEYKKVMIQFSGGECLLELNRIIYLVHLSNQLANQLGIIINYAIVTNGVLINKKSAQLLKKNNINVAVSLDGLDKYHDAQRVFPDGSGTFKYVEKGIKNLLATNVAFHTTVTITSKNIENIPDLTKYFLDNNISFVFNFYAENPCVQEDLKADDKKLIKYLKKSFRIIYNYPFQNKIIPTILDYISFKKPHLSKCSIGHGFLVINHKGKLASCPSTIDQPIGSIEDDDIIETTRKSYLVSKNRLSVEKITSCKNCQWIYTCCGGCSLLTFRYKGRYDANSPYCKVYKALIPEVLRLEAKRLIKYGMQIYNNKNNEKTIFV